MVKEITDGSFQTAEPFVEKSDFKEAEAVGMLWDNPEQAWVICTVYY